MQMYDMLCKCMKDGMLIEQPNRELLQKVLGFSTQPLTWYVLRVCCMFKNKPKLMDHK